MQAQRTYPYDVDKSNPMPGSRLELVSIVNGIMKNCRTLDADKRRQQKITKITGVVIRERIANPGGLVPSSSDWHLVPRIKCAQQNESRNEQKDVNTQTRRRSISDVRTACGGKYFGLRLWVLHIMTDASDALSSRLGLGLHPLYVSEGTAFSTSSLVLCSHALMWVRCGWGGGGGGIRYFVFCILSSVTEWWNQGRKELWRDVGRNDRVYAREYQW